MRILLKCPTRSRPARVLKTLSTYIRLASRPDLLGVAVSCDVDDPTMTDTAELKKVLAPCAWSRIFYGHNTTKIQACNANMSEIDWDWGGLSALVDYFSRITANEAHRDKAWIAAFTDRQLTRLRESGRFSNAPDTKQQRDLAEKIARDIPILLLFRQEGTKEQGWSGHPFWWPVFVAPFDATPCVYAKDVDRGEGEATTQ